MLRQACPELVEGLGTNGDSSIARLLTVRSAPVEACPEHSRRGRHLGNSSAILLFPYFWLKAEN